MRTFHVPQFIEVEDKIFGPLTLKQFIYILGGGGLVFIIWAFLGTFFAVLFGAPVAVFFLALAFYKINEQPFIKVLGNAISYSAKSRLYIWKKIEKKKAQKQEDKKTKQGLVLPKLTESKLKDLSWSLDIKEELKR